MSQTLRNIQKSRQGVQSNVVPFPAMLEQFKGEKQLVFKFKKRKRYHRTRGHRQNLTRIRIKALPVEAAAKSAESAE